MADPEEYTKEYTPLMFMTYGERCALCLTLCLCSAGVVVKMHPTELWHHAGYCPAFFYGADRPEDL